MNEDGTLGFKKSVAKVTSRDPKRIEEELVNFTDSLLNGRQVEHLQDTGAIFSPDYTHLDEFLASQDSQDFS